MVDGNRMSTFAIASEAAHGSTPSPTWTALAAIAGNRTDAVNFASRVAGGSAPLATSVALTAVAVAGNAAVIVLLLAPMLTFVRPISKEGSVGERSVYPHLLALLNNVAWALYATASGSLAFYYVNLAGVILQVFYIVFFLWFATEKKHQLARILFFAVIVVSGVMTALVYYMVIQQHRWDIRFVGAMASVSGGFMQAVPLFDLVTVMRSKRVDGTSLIKAFISLFNASAWTAYGRMVIPINFYIMAPNLFGVVSTVLQIGVYLAVHLRLIYYKTSATNSVKGDANQAGRALQDHGRELKDLAVSPV